MQLSGEGREADK